MGKTVKVENLVVLTEEDERFIEELDQLCKRYAEEGDFYYSFRVEE